LILLFVSCSSNPQKAKGRYFAEGQKYLKNGQYGDASIEFRNALRIDPRFVDAYYQLSQADLAQHDWQSAYGSLEKVIELDPGRLDARLDRGRLYLSARQFDKSEKEARSILHQEPINVGAWQLLGDSLTGEQKLDLAFAAFSHVAELLPSDTNSYMNLALIEISLRRFSDAEKHLKQAVAKNPSSSQATITLANFYLLQNNLSQAQEALQAGILDNPVTPQLYVEWATMLSNYGDLKQADGVLNKLRNKMPESLEATIAIGDYYAQQRDLDKALAEYQRGLSISADNLHIENRMEELYLTSNRTDQASKLDERLMKKAPKDVLVMVAHGRLLLAQGKQRDALIALQKAVNEAPNSAQVHYYLGVAYCQTENLAHASGEFQEALQVLPGFPPALQVLAQLNLAQNHLSDARIYAQEMVQKYPADADGRMLLGRIFLNEGQSHPAEEQFLAASRIAPNRAAIHLDLGQAYSAEKKWTKAEKEFKNAVQLDPSNPAILAPYADFLVARQQTPKAIALLQRFVDANPKNAQAHVILGALRFNAKDMNGARAEFEHAIQCDPKNIQGYLQIARVYQEQHQTDAAIGQYQKALNLSPNSASLLTMIGNLYLDKQDFEAARKYYAQALDVDPNFAMANANMAWIDAQENKDLDVALGMAQKAKSFLPEVPSVSDTLAWVMYKKGDYSEAIPLLNECVKKTPDSAQFHYHLGLALVADGQVQAGKAQILAALHLNKLATADKEQAQHILAQPN
jgi:tetratricopeptide (TPR) repeat protein